MTILSNSINFGLPILLATKFLIITIRLFTGNSEDDPNSIFYDSKPLGILIRI